MDNPPEPQRPSARRFSLRRVALALVAAAAAYAAATYLVVPLVWKRYAHRHPALEDCPTITYTASGIPGDPLNVGLVATEPEFKAMMIAARWYPADPLTLKSCLEIAEATVLKRPYDDAPVSSLYLWKRKEDLAFEQPVGDDPRRRHHVRFWRSDKTDADGRPLWIGSATYDQRVGLSHTTGQITHHIAADVDAERDHLVTSWQQTGRLARVELEPDFQPHHEGRNGGGDPWRTDGTLKIGIAGGR